MAVINIPNTQVIKQYQLQLPIMMSTSCNANMIQPFH